jgi:hypothetical protein
MIEFSEQICADFNESISREWLETNGLGGFASSTIAGVKPRGCFATRGVLRSCCELLWRMFTHHLWWHRLSGKLQRERQCQPKPLRKMPRSLPIGQCIGLCGHRLKFAAAPPRNDLARKG